ncbi:hypothetical protein ABT255_41690 [Streptomyces mirabilis]|uniref:hypothetical protein n=1 Tax=Streptomyces mirabilis TaxID=68239 RepID=UPI003331AB41
MYAVGRGPYRSGTSRHGEPVHARHPHNELADAGTGVQAAHVGIDVSIGTAVIPGLPTAQPEQIAPVYWELHATARDQAERV